MQVDSADALMNGVIEEFLHHLFFHTLFCSFVLNLENAQFGSIEYIFH